MDKSDPNTWTESYVSSNRAECLRELRGVNSQVMSFIRQKNYLPAIAGLDRILNGLITMQNGKCGDLRSHIAMFSMCEGAIIAFCDIGADVSESRQRETALKCFEDAHDFSRSEATKENIRAIIAELKSGVPLARIKAEHGEELPESMILDMLADLNSRLSGVSSSSSTSAGSGDDYDEMGKLKRKLAILLGVAVVITVLIKMTGGVSIFEALAGGLAGGLLFYIPGRIRGLLKVGWIATIIITLVYSSILIWLLTNSSSSWVGLLVLILPLIDIGYSIYKVIKK